MAEAEGVNIKANGSWIGDSLDEFKKLPTWGKFALVAVVGVVVYLAIRARNAATAQSAAGTALQGSTGGIGATGSSAGGTQSPYPSVNGLPVLPSNTNPLYGPGGDLVGFQTSPPPATTPAPTSTPAPVAKPAPTGTPAKPAPKTSGTGNPLVPQGVKVPGTLGSSYSYNGATYTVVPGGGGRIWGVPGKVSASQATGASNKVLLSAPANYYKPNRGGGNVSMLALIEDPLKYLASSVPHVHSGV
jgi:hypothetical protein